MIGLQELRANRKGNITRINSKRKLYKVSCVAKCARTARPSTPFAQPEQPKFELSAQGPLQHLYRISSRKYGNHQAEYIDRCTDLLLCDVQLDWRVDYTAKRKRKKGVAAMGSRPKLAWLTNTHNQPRERRYKRTDEIHPPMSVYQRATSNYYSQCIVYSVCVGVLVTCRTCLRHRTATR